MTKSGTDAKIVLDHLHSLLGKRQSRPVDMNGLRALDVAERSFAGKADCIGEFKFSANHDMLKYIEQGNA
jgi:ferredoxin--NADP+ reductase